MSFKHQVIWITGASSGIGEALAYAFARAGAHLVLSARREEALQEVAARCQTGDNRVQVLAFDVTDMDLHPAMVAEVLKVHGRIDVLVLNAGVSQRSKVLDTKMEVYRALFELNFFSIVSLTQQVLPHMLAQGKGALVPIASVAGRISTPRRAGYGASKHALIGFFDALRAECHEAGLRVHTILPGYIKTNISLHALKEDGGAYGQMDPNQAKGLDVDYTAERIVQAIASGKPEFFIGGRLEAFGLFVKRFFPSLAFFLLRKIKNT